jgi:nicotinate-nucleotide--dimethylbenzimidazole phosphoribosyltransferase
MPQHEIKSCPRCNIVFECKVGSISLCQCSSITLSSEEQAFIDTKYQDCLCVNCLKDIKNKYTMTIIQQLQYAINKKTKPLGSLGLLEDIALQIGLIQQTITPQIIQPHIVVFAADHGIATLGLVNPYPQAVTAQMALNFANGGAAINVFTKQHNIGLIVVDAGVNHHFKNVESIVDCKIAYGTKNYLIEPAMSEAEALQAMDNGRQIVAKLATQGCNTIGFGEIGISNTSSASLIMSAITGITIEACIGKGTGVNDAQLQTKIETLTEVFALHNLQDLGNNPVQLLSTIGGFEIATMVGAYLQAANNNMVIVVDGFIATAALLLAQQHDTDIVQNCVFAHTSGEQGHEKMLSFLQAKPLLQLGMRLGEGTGAALAMPLIQSAVLFLNQMASFESAGVSGVVGKS